jgi:hypothetical protein
MSRWAYLIWTALALTVGLYLFWNSDGETAGGHDRPYHVVRPLR